MAINPIKHFRHKHSLSQRKQAEMLGVGIRTVQRWESGERAPHSMTLQLLERIDKELDERTP